MKYLGSSLPFFPFVKYLSKTNYKMQKRKFVFSLVLLFSVLFCAAQNEARIWYFGNGLGLDFSSPTPSLLTNGSITTSVGCSAICSSSGTLLFYTDGVTIWNQTHAIMANGTGLFGNPGAQNSVVVKRPASSTQYYIFTVQGGGGSAGLRYSIVDMTLAAGLGSVTVKNASVFPYPCEEKISATRHCNQTDAWIMVHEMNTQNFQAFQLTATGISTMVTSSFSPQPTPMTTISTHTGYSPRGTMKFSPNGRRFAEIFSVSNPTIPIANGGVTTGIYEIYDFDNSSGLLSNIYTPLGFSGPSNNWSYGTEFSPDGTKLYFTYFGGVGQVNHCVYPPGINWSIPGSGDQPPSTQKPASLQLGPDGKIYVAIVGSSSLGVINNPNDATPACNYVPSAISLGTAVCGFGLPNYYTPFFEKSSITFTANSAPGANCNTLNFFVPLNCVTLLNASGPFTGYSISNYLWNFGDPLSGSSNTATSGVPSHSFTSPGTYTVQLLLSYLCGRTDTIRKTVTINPSALLSISSPSLSCGVTSASVFVTGAVGALSYSWTPSLATTSVASNLSPGIHTAYVYDAGTGCTYISSFNTNTTVISNTVIASNTCPGVITGTASVLVSGGSGTYSYNWIGSTNTGSFSASLSLGSHTVIVSDAINNCTLNTVFQISQAPPIVLNLAPNINGSLCTGNSLTVSSVCSGGNPPYNYTWSNGPITNSITITQSTSGTYNYTCNVLDSKNCPTSQTFSVVYYSTPTLAVSNATSCSGTTVNLLASGALSYVWLPMNSAANPCVVSPTSTSTYTLIGQNGICGSMETVTVTVKAKPILSMLSNAPMCAGNSLNLSASGANTLLWSGPSGFISNLPNPSLNPVSFAASGIYTLTGTGTNSCTAISTLAVVIYSLPPIAITANNPLCVGQTLSLSVLPGNSYQWNGPVGFSSSLPNPVLFGMSANQSGIYTLSVVTADSCKATNSISVSVNPIPAITVSGPTLICLGESITLLASGGTTYLWSNSSNTSSIVVSPLTNVVYTATGTALGCSNQAQIKIKVSECTSIEESDLEFGLRCFPNPANTELKIFSEEAIEVKLFDQSGILLSEYNFLSGTHLISIERLAAGIYYLQALKQSKQVRMFKVVKVD